MVLKPDQFRSTLPPTFGLEIPQLIDHFSSLHMILHHEVEREEDIFGIREKAQVFVRNPLDRSFVLFKTRSFCWLGIL